MTDRPQDHDASTCGGPESCRYCAEADEYDRPQESMGLKRAMEIAHFAMACRYAWELEHIPHHPEEIARIAEAAAVLRSHLERVELERAFVEAARKYCAGEVDVAKWDKSIEEEWGARMLEAYRALVAVEEKNAEA